MLPTERDSIVEHDRDDAPVPGAIVVWSGTAPTLRALRVPATGLIVGRDLLGDTGDDRLSRRHVAVRWTGRGFRIAELGSRNGTSVDGALVTGGEVDGRAGTVVRAGRTLAILVSDVRAFEGAAVTTVDGAVVCPTLRATWDAVTRAAHAGRSLLVTGESGTGKELAARVFHRASAVAGELVAVNCATIASGLAERLLFGTRRGAYSGADKDADGLVATADGGTLFLDEIAELDLAVQPKLLRVLETGELLPLGASRPRPVALRVVAATLRDLRAAVQAGRFRDDLYYRIGRPEVHVPPLRERREEVGYLVAAALAPAGIAAHPSLVETCLLRPWPGNVRELVGEVARAGHDAAAAGRPAVRAEDLDDAAGRAVPSAVPAAASDGAETAPATMSLPDDPAAIAEALRAEQGNVTAAARRLGVHRNQLRRYLARQAGEPDQ